VKTEEPGSRHDGCLPEPSLEGGLEEKPGVQPASSLMTSVCYIQAQVNYSQMKSIMLKQRETTPKTVALLQPVRKHECLNDCKRRVDY